MVRSCPKTPYYLDRKKVTSSPLTLQHRAINRVESKYPDPETYRPERWLEPGWPTYQEPLTRYPNFRDGHGMHTFGWGRRACLGREIAQDEMFVSGAAVCWAFGMAPSVCPATGEPVPIDSFATNAHVILEPLPWQMSFQVRSRERAAQILEGYRGVQAELKV